MANSVPTPAQIESYGIDQGAVLTAIQREVEFEIDGIQTGSITVDHRGRAYHLRNAQRRMKRLEKLAHDFGHWLDAEPHRKAPTIEHTL